MADTLSKIYIHVVFAVKYRKSLIDSEWEEILYQYITGIVRNKQQKILAINGMPDHIHFLIRMKPDCNLSDLVREIKKSSNDFVNANRLSANHFSWQNGYGAFSYSNSQIGIVSRYIENQKAHHKVISFKSEYLDFLKKLKISDGNKYLFNHE